MRPMVDDLELVQVQEVLTADHRVLAEHRPPGMDGSLLQNLGRRSAVVVLRGVATGPDAAAFVEQLDGKFRAGLPVTFTADIVADAGIEQVRIDDLNVEEQAGRPQRFAYVLTLREHLQPVAPVDTSAVDAGILDEAADLASGLVDALDIGPAIVGGLERFVPTLTGLLQRLKDANQRIQDARG